MSSQSSDKLFDNELQEPVTDKIIDDKMYLKENNDVEHEELKQNHEDKEDEEDDENDEDDEEPAESDDNENIIDEDEDNEDDDDFDLDEDGEIDVSKTVGKKTSTKRGKNTTGTSDDIIGLLNMNENIESSDEEDDEQINGIMDDEYDDEDDEDLDTYLQKFDEEVNTNYLLQEHPNEFNKNYDEIDTLCNIVRDENNNIIDPLHKTLPYLTKYERTRVLGQRAKQINSGSKPFINVPDNIIDGYIIAEMELSQKRIPFIIQRPLHGGVTEYWKLRDLEIL